jgi:PAT family beta-lactamase induction signal transducer AmpG
MEQGSSSRGSVPRGARRRLIASIGLLGFVAGLPNVLVNDTLSAWLADLGFGPKDIGLLSLVTLPYGLKLLWAPLLDRFAAPGFAWLGPRRSWIALFSLLLAVAFALLAWSGPESAAASVVPAAVVGLAIATLSATLDAAVDAHRTDGASGGEEGPAASAFVLGYRVAFVSIGAAVLMLHGKIALLFGPEGDAAARALAWRWAIGIGGLAMLLGCVAVLLAPEPPRRRTPETLADAVVQPFRSFARSLGGRIAVVFFVALLFRLPDLLGNRMTMPFLRQQMGFDIAEIGTIRQALGFTMTIVGAVVGGICVKRWGLFRALVVFGVLQVASNAGYLVLAAIGKSLPAFAGVVVVESLCNGLVSAAFVAYFMTLCEPRFAAAQYAILSGLMFLAGALVGSTSGFLVEALGYPGFFVLSIAVGVPPLVALRWAMPRPRAQEGPCCAGCGYLLAGLPPEAACPECGGTARLRPER